MNNDMILYTPTLFCFIVDAFSMLTSENRLNIGILKYHSINK